MGIKNCSLEFDSHDSVPMTAPWGHDMKDHQYLVSVTWIESGWLSVSYAG